MAFDLDDEELEATRRLNEVNNKIKRPTLKEIEQYIKSNYKYRADIQNDKLVVKYKNNTLTIKIFDTTEYSCFDDKKWISIDNMQGMSGHAYGINARDYTTKLIDRELEYFKKE